jgi:hypothetical protein
MSNKITNTCIKEL